MTRPSSKRWQFAAITFAMLLCGSLPALADVVLIGTGDPAADVPAVQAAVDAGGIVQLQGTFSFDIAPIDERTVLVSNSVILEGIPDAAGNLPTIVPIGERFVDGIRILGSGSYLVAHNHVEVGYENAAGIRVQGGGIAVQSAVVFNNDVQMSLPENATSGAEHAGIEVRRTAVNNIVVANRIRGIARAAVALIGEPIGAPNGTTLSGNNLASMASSLADVYIGPGVIGTTVLGGHGTLIDEGNRTVVKGGYQ
jgi:hypothetical protein